MVKWLHGGYQTESRVVIDIKQCPESTDFGADFGRQAGTLALQKEEQPHRGAARPSVTGGDALHSAPRAIEC